jgi:bifunctional DNA-binding transcriptional regulator/antitoxin component of YhaV-PrlF toxin-antitoxin module
MKILYKVGSRGQVTIDKAIRDKLGVKPKDVAVQQVVDGKVVISFMPAPHRRSLRGALKSKPIRPWKNIHDLDDLIAKEVTKEYLRRQRRAGRERGR